MQQSLAMDYQSFKEILVKQFSGLFGKIDEKNEWELKVEVNNEMGVILNLKEAWKAYEKSGNITVLTKYINTQNDILMTLNTKERTYDDIKDFLIPTIRSKEFLNKMHIREEILQKNVAKDLQSVILFDQERITQILNRKDYPFLPNDEEIFALALENLMLKGWTGETQRYQKDPFDLLIFEEKNHSSHYQFFIKEWLNKEIGDCYIAFPTHKIAMVLKVKSDDWKDWIKCLNFFNKSVNKAHSEEPFPLSNTIIKYENGNYEVL
ncbi:hypothetical protein MZM54_02460 [[Brevibacterium] frigoritolerans]|nr:hypothetical protein [Peribacillus frigoritolerans]